MLELALILSLIKSLVLCAVVFVWIVRYHNIVEEFKYFGYPSWLRDLVGILKLTFVFLIMNQNLNLVFIGSSGICLLMLAAFFTHLRVKNPFSKMMPSLTLFLLSGIVLVFNS